MSEPTVTTTEIEALPERMRAHAAAKALGMTSKALLTALAAEGVELKSAQSTVTREALLAWAGNAGTEKAPATKAPAKKVAAKKAAAKKAPAKKAAATKATATKAPATKAGAEEPASDSDQPESAPTKAVAKKSAAKKSVPKKSSAGEKKSTGGSSATPDAPESSSGAGRSREPLPEIAIVTGEVGIEQSGGGRRGRRRSEATPSFSPLFLSADETEKPEPVAGDLGDDGAPESGPERSGEDGDDEQGGGRKRRRGRRGRGRGRGENGEGDNGAENDSTDRADDSSHQGREAHDSGTADAANDSGKAQDPGKGQSSDKAQDSGGQDSADHSQEGSGEEGGNGSRRRRRRRRGKGGDNKGGDSQNQNQNGDNGGDRKKSGKGSDQSKGTGAEEVQGISGSTRLEAKRQRRRDGREAGRRRQPILSEAEFLARRESVDRVMVVREKQNTDRPGSMTQVGVLEDGVLVEHFVTTESARSMVGNVYLGRVQNVLPSMEAAFVDIGRGRNGVLYAGEVNWEAAGLGGRARRIEQALRPGDPVLVQVTKDPIGQKGARLTTQISLAGRFLVYVPDGNSTGISRKLPDTERKRLKAILKDVVPEGSGVIIRTAAEGVSEEEIGRDVARLAAQWEEISSASEKRIAKGSGSPVALYEEPDLLVKVVRDLFNEDFSSLVIEGDDAWETVHEYVARVAPEMEDRLHRYHREDGGSDVFGAYRVGEQLAKALDRKVWLPSGGSLVIDRTEAMTVIDVNTGKFTGSGGNLEETVTRNNLEAAEEIVRQLRLRDVGGMVVIDFIDMVLEANRDLILRRLTEALGRDRTRHQVSEVTSLGLVQMTRKKLGTGLIEAFSTPCEHCGGRGLVVHADPVHTESHNADEPGDKRGRRRGGRSNGGSGRDAEQYGQGAHRKDGPAPSAHPAALAMHKHEDEPGEDAPHSEAGASAPATDSVSGETVATESAATASETGAPTVGGSANVGSASDASPAGKGSGRSRSRSRRKATSAPAAPAATETSETENSSPEKAGTEKSGSEKAGPEKSRPAKAKSEKASTEKSNTAKTDTDETVTEKSAVSEPSPAPEASPERETPTTGARRGRRRATSRPAGSAAPASSSSSPSSSSEAVATPPAGAPDPGAALPAEPVPAGAATGPNEEAGSAGPRRRPARRRATRPSASGASTEA